MKVLIFAENDHSIPRRYWETSIPLLRDKGVDVQYATIQSREPLHERLEALGIPAIAFGGSRATDYFRVTAELRRLIKKERFDIVHASESIAATLAGLACLSIPSTKCLFHYHHIYFHGTQRIFSRVGSRLADLIMNVSESSRRGAIKFDGVSRKKTKVAYNGTEPLRQVSVAEVERERRDLNIPNQALVLSIVARLRKEKGHRTLFEAAGIIAADIDLPVHVVVAGEGAERENLVDFSKSIPKVKVHFVGNKEDIAPFFAIGDVIVMPSYDEPFGLVAIEAMSFGKPLVASDIDGIAEIVIDGASGILVPPREPHQLAAAIRRVVDSPELSQVLGANGRARVEERFTISSMVDGWIKCYKHLLKKN